MFNILFSYNGEDIGRFSNLHQCTRKGFIKDNKLVLKTQQRFKSERHNIFTEEINKIALILNDDKKAIN